MIIGDHLESHKDLKIRTVEQVREEEIKMTNLSHKKGFWMVRNYKLFYLSILLFFIYLILNIPFPHRYPFGESFLGFLGLPKQFNIPGKSSGELFMIDLITSNLLLVGLYILGISVSKYPVRIVLFAFFSLASLQVSMIQFYQATSATGIYAVSYENRQGTCQFHVNNGEPVYGECDLRFKNHSNAAVDFEMEFDNDVPMVSLMNDARPYVITLREKETRDVTIRMIIDESEIDHVNEKTKIEGIDIIIRSNGKEREL